MPDTYVRDLSVGTTERVDVDSAGTEVPQGTNLADSPAISGSGRFVAFVSIDPGLSPGDTNGAFDVFVRDRKRGTTARVSLAADGAQAANRIAAHASSAPLGGCPHTLRASCRLAVLSSVPWRRQLVN